MSKRLVLFIYAISDDIAVDKNMFFLSQLYVVLSSETSNWDDVMTSKVSLL